MSQSGLGRVARVLVMPGDGAAALVPLIDAATRSLLVKMFTFDSPALIAAVVAARARGVSARVMLNPRRSSGSRANDATDAALRAGGVAVAWTNPAFAVTHEKSMVVDGRAALIATFNFSDKYLTRTRDYGLVVDDPAAVRQIADCFEADWRREPFALPEGSPLLLSTGNSRAAMAGFIDAARHSLLVQHPKFSDLAILDRLLQARARGVHLHVLCGGAHGISPGDMVDTFSALRSLARAGARVRRQRGLRLHAKLLVADAERALLGSMNIDRSAFDLRRELGAVVDDRRAVAALRHRFDGDWHDAEPYDPPDPMTLHLEPGSAPPHDRAGPDLLHE